MPLVTIYFQNSEYQDQLQQCIDDFKKMLAEKLSCSDITLSPSEISIRFLNVSGGGMIAKVECEITAHAFLDRTEKQDEICSEVAIYLKDKTSIKDIKVWLTLVELGHSW